uniref:Uncharacterized protein n=1 Tax=Siphoviridae sp. ctFH16 TaxID=2827817 RepID=A0A8S5TN68_9CAUD|nr:MAG TPA: hypothetical protein [Siphoviridae sp. ctFH16]
MRGRKQLFFFLFHFCSSLLCFPHSLFLLNAV